MIEKLYVHNFRCFENFQLDFDGTQRGRESFSVNDQPHGKRLTRKRLPTPSTKRDASSFADPKRAQ
jgi:hypothetical protein